MKNEGQKSQGVVATAATPTGRGNRVIPGSFRAISGYLRIVSSGASTVASSVRSAASSIVVNRDEDVRCNQVLWAGFGKLELERDIVRRVLLLGYRSGFQVWDVEEAHNVHDLVSRHDGPVTFLQMLPKPLSTVASRDKFSDSRPMLVVYTDGSLFKDGKIASCNGSIPDFRDPGDGLCGPSTVRFFSLPSQSYVHVLKFRSVVYSVRCSARVIAVSQAAQVHCFNAATLEKEYTILTNPAVTSSPGSGGIGYGPLALGPRWLAYSGSPIDVSSAGRVSPQHLTPSATFPSSASNGSRVALYAKESGKHLAAGIVNLGDMGYKKLSRYCSELLPDTNHSVQYGVTGGKANGTINGHLPDMDNVGMVIVKDVVSKSVITQFRAHKSPILALCFDPSGTLLVTASVQGHNINVFHIMPGHPGVSSESGASGSYVHLYRLQRGLTNAIIQDITFSDDSRWIMISSSRGTNHLFAISPFGGAVDLKLVDTCCRTNGLNVAANQVVRWTPKPAGLMFNQKNLFESGPPVALSVVSRIRSGNNGWRGTVNGVAAVATGKKSSLSGANAVAFHLCKGNDMHVNTCTAKSKYHLLVFSPGSLIQYALRVPPRLDAATAVTGVNPAYEPAPDIDSKVIVEATQKWNVCQKRREREDNFDIYGENSSSESTKLYCEATRNGYGAYHVGECMNTRSKTSPEERNHLYISEAELQMHDQQVPIWARSEIYFQSMVNDGINIDDENAGGETEIERISVRSIEARSENLVPVYNYLDKPKSQLARIAGSGSKSGPSQVLEVSGFSQNLNLLTGDQPFAFGLTTENGGEVHHSIGETTDGALKPANTTMGSVNTTDSPIRKCELQIVNNRDREDLKTEAHFKLVNNCCDALKMENQVEDEGGGRL